MIQKHVVSRDDSIYESFPDVTLTRSGRLVCTFAECTHHNDRSYTRIMLSDSTDRGKTWSAKRALTAEKKWKQGESGEYWNCPRISTLADGRLIALCDTPTRGEPHYESHPQNWMWISSDEGETWTDAIETPAVGIVPDQLIELKQGTNTGRRVLSAHTILLEDGEERWVQRCWLSDDTGDTWSEPIVIASREDLKLCEGSVVELPTGELVCFMRENSGQGLDAFKAVSTDGGETWSGLTEFPLPGCHRPVAGMLSNGQVLITHRYMQGGLGWIGWWTQNFFAGLTDVESCLAVKRNQAHTRILPLDFDRHRESDTGYSGWVEFPGGGLYVVNYILDDAPKAQIRGYSLELSDFLLPGE